MGGNAEMYTTPREAQRFDLLFTPHVWGEGGDVPTEVLEMLPVLDRMALSPKLFVRWEKHKYSRNQ